MKRLLVGALLFPLASSLAIQLVPYGRAHVNPAVTGEPSWDSPRTRQFAALQCFDCHSNQTEWPWYSNVAPMSWMIQRDVDVGRTKLNFSEWNRPQEEAENAAETVREGEMPPWYYLLPRPQVRLSAAETATFVRGLQATLGGEAREGDAREDNGDQREGGGDEGEDDDDEGPRGR